jgi:hypothetical protein
MRSPSPRRALGFVVGDAARLVPFFDVLGPPFLLVGVLGFVASGHSRSPNFYPAVSGHRPGLLGSG